MRVGVLGRVSCQGCTAKLAAAKEARGKEAGRFAFLLLSPLLAFLGHQEKALTGRTGGSWVLGARGAWCDSLPSFICSMSLSALLRAVLGKEDDTGAVEGREKREAKQKRGAGDRRQEGKGYPACLSGHMEPKACAGM